MCSRICASKTDVNDLLAKLKITPCPHCNKTGFLNRHGSLLGSTLNLMGNVVRGARAVRVYCSDRNNSSGCGRTFSVWTADKIKYLFLSAECLLQFLSDAVSSGNIVQAFRNLKSGLNDPAASTCGAGKSSCATNGITKGPSSSTKTDAVSDKPDC